MNSSGLLFTAKCDDPSEGILYICLSYYISDFEYEREHEWYLFNILDLNLKRLLPYVTYTHTCIWVDEYLESKVCPV